MATYIALTSFTDQGIRTVKDTIKLARRCRATETTHGVYYYPIVQPAA